MAVVGPVAPPAYRRTVRPALPTGLVTFVFSDIEGSTQRWETRREAMQLALRRHDRLLRTVIESHNGRVFKTMGDQFCSVFWSAPEAVAAALRIQRAIDAEDWSAIDGLHVRVAIHTGVTDERDGDYFGPAVNRVARLLALGHGGQVLLTGFAAELVSEHLPPAAQLRDLGSHRLKDLAHPERVYQLVTSESAHAVKQLRPLGAPTNLPVLLNAFLGREAEVNAVAQLLASARLVTLTGSGGVGKTRTALHVAGKSLEGYDDGVWLVELAPVSDANLVPSAIAAVFNVEDRGGARTIIENVAGALKGKRALIVLDNCEHVVAAAADAADRILRTCAGVRVIATSREALHIDGERIYRLPSLAVPPAGRIGARKASAYCAVALFVERARAATQHFALTDANAPVVADIVRRLDGIALAIELAAARVGTLPVEEIAKRLDERFKLLKGGSRTALPRQQTLRALIEWSYDLLDDVERSLFLQLAVFRDGWTLEAARSVSVNAGATSWDVLALLSKLVDKSLVVAESDRGELRYRLLESTRQYALERLQEKGELAHVAARHCRYFREVSDRLSDGYWTINEDRHLAPLSAELENYRAAISWGLAERNDVRSGALIVANLSALWKDRLSREGHVLVERALTELGDCSPSIRARLLMVRAHLTFEGGLGLDAATEAVALLERGTDRMRLADALRLLGNSVGRIGRLSEAAERLEQALAVARPLQLDRLTAAILNWLAYCLAYQGQLARSRAAFAESLALTRAAGDPARMPLNNFAELQFIEGDVTAAVASAREAIAILREVGTVSQIMISSNNLAAYLEAAGELLEAWTLARHALEVAVRLEKPMSAAIAMQHLAQIAARRGDVERAAVLIGYVDAVYARERHPREPTERYGYERIVALVRATYAPGRLTALAAQGAALGESAAAALALAIERPSG